MHVEINKINDTNVEFCEAQDGQCFLRPEFIVEISNPEDGTLELHNVCADHVTEALPVFGHAA